MKVFVRAGLRPLTNTFMKTQPPRVLLDVSVHGRQASPCREHTVQKYFRRNSLVGDEFYRRISGRLHAVILP